MAVAYISRAGAPGEALTRTRKPYQESGADFSSCLAGLIQQGGCFNRPAVSNPPWGETGQQDGSRYERLQEPAGPEPAGITGGKPVREATGSPREDGARPAGRGNRQQINPGTGGTAGSEGRVDSRNTPAGVTVKDDPAGKDVFQAGDGPRVAAGQGSMATAGEQVKDKTAPPAGKAKGAPKAALPPAGPSGDLLGKEGAGANVAGAKKPDRADLPDRASRVGAVAVPGATGKAAGGDQAVGRVASSGPAPGGNLAVLLKGKDLVQGDLWAGVSSGETGTAVPGDPGTARAGGNLAGEYLKFGLPQGVGGRQQAGAGKAAGGANGREITDRAAGTPLNLKRHQAVPVDGEGSLAITGPVPGNSLAAGYHKPANTGPGTRWPPGEAPTGSGGNSPVGPAVFTAVMGGNSQQAGSPAARINNLPEVFATLLDTARLAATNSRQQLELQLQPENLGKLKLRALLDGGRLTLQLLVESSEAARALQAAVPEMRQAVAVQGLRLDQVQVQVGGDGQDGGRRQAGSQGEYSQDPGWRHRSPEWPGSYDGREGTINWYRLDYLA